MLGWKPERGDHPARRRHRADGQGCLAGSLSFNGQRCTALKMILVHQSIAEQFLRRFSDELAKLKMGMPWEKGVMIHAAARWAKVAYMNECIEDAVAKGAKVLNAGGGTSVETMFYPAVLFPVTEGMKLYREEVRPGGAGGPFEDLEEALQYVITSDHGQQVSVFGKDPDLIARLVDPLVDQVGRVNINCQCQRSPDVFPFVGRKDSAEARCRCMTRCAPLDPHHGRRQADRGDQEAARRDRARQQVELPEHPLHPDPLRAGTPRSPPPRSSARPFFLRTLTWTRSSTSPGWKSSTRAATPSLQATVRFRIGRAGHGLRAPGASTGAREALELRDGDKARFGGRGVLKALANIEGPIAAALAGADGREQAAIDARLIEPRRQRRQIRARRQRAARGLARHRPRRRELGRPAAVPLPGDRLEQPGPCRPADERHQRRRARQQQPRHPGMHDRAERLRALWRGAAPVETFHTLRALLDKQGLPTSVGDEGSFAPTLAGTRQALELILEAIRKTAASPAARSAWRSTARLRSSTATAIPPHAIAEAGAPAASPPPRHPGGRTRSWHRGRHGRTTGAGWGILTDRLGRRAAGGRRPVRPQHRDLRRRHRQGIANAILIKANQIGTLTETLAAMSMASKAGYASIVSHRSGETGDISSPTWRATKLWPDQDRLGEPRRPRVEKYKIRLLAIEREAQTAP